MDKDSLFVASEKALQVRIDHIRHSGTWQVKTECAPDFMDVDDRDLQFRQPVNVVGEAYVTGDDLIVRFSAETVAQMPCIVCFGMVDVPISVTDCYQVIPLDEIKRGIFDASAAVREELVFAAPQFVECHEGKCPEREVLQVYFRSPDRSDESDEGHQPFAGL